MYSRNTKGQTAGYEYPFTLPERYGGSRFRPMREPTTHVHTERSTPRAAPPESKAEVTVIDDASLPPALPPAITDTFAEVTLEQVPSEAESTTEEQRAAAPTTEPKSNRSPFPLLPRGEIASDDLLLAGLILLLTREGENSGDLAALLALLFAYRGPGDK